MLDGSSSDKNKNKHNMETPHLLEVSRPTVLNMQQPELRKLLRANRDHINMEPDWVIHFSAFVNGSLPNGLGKADNLRAVAIERKFPASASWVLPAATDTKPEADKDKPTKAKSKRDQILDILNDLDEGPSREEIAAIVEAAIDKRIKDGQMVEKIVITPTETKKVEGATHKVFKAVCKIVSAGLNGSLVGGAGTGKTHMCMQVAKALNLPFYFTSKVDSEHKLLGFRDAKGEYKKTVFREAFENGGLFLWDEFDTSNPKAVTAFNAALDNRICDFPDGNIKAHPDFRALAASNTFWSGATREYVGRNPMDAASKDRFTFITVDYDSNLENSLAAQYEGGPEIAKRIQLIRKAVEKLKIKIVVSMRATMSIAKLRNVGFTEKAAYEAGLWKGLAPADVRRINETADSLIEKEGEA